MQERERLVLYTVVLILALVVGFLAWRIESNDGRAPLPPVPVEDFVQAVKGEFEGFEGRVAKAVIDTLPDPMPREAIGEIIKDAINLQLTGLDGRVADAVYDKLKGEGVCKFVSDEKDRCPEPPSPPPVGKNFTFLFDNAHLDSEGDVKRGNKGVRLDWHHEKRLELIVKAFRACQTTDNAVSFHVAGYSSTAHFYIETESGPKRLPGTDALNLATANMRMENVADYLKDEGFKVKAERWGSIAALQRPYIDDFEPGVDQQALNRTVFLQVTNAGRCDLSQLASPRT